MKESECGVPFFVVGAGRSGTTLLRQMLNCHPLLAVTPESHFIPWFYNELSTYGDLSNRHNALKLIRDIAATERFKEWSMELEDVEAFYAKYTPSSYKAIVTALYQEYAERHGKLRWGDKTPAYVKSIEILLEVFPNSKIIHLVRDGRDVYLSHKKVTWGPKTASGTAIYWSDCLKGIEDCKLLNKENLLEVKYENLVTEPAQQIAKICDFLQVDYDEHLVDYQKYAKNDVKHWKSQHFNKKITPQTQKYVSNMSNRKIRSFERIASRFLRKYGYNVHHPTAKKYTQAQIKLLLATDKVLQMLFARLNHPESRIGSVLAFRGLRRLSRLEIKNS